MTASKSIDNIKADYNLFIEIQMGKYLKSCGKDAFDSNREAEKIISKIIETYNKLVAHEHKRLDSSDLPAKTAWFNSIEIDFTNKDSSGKKTNWMPNINKETPEFLQFYDDILSFLPKGSVMLLMFAGPALEAYGYSFERFKKILDGIKITEIEEDIFYWAFYTVQCIISAFYEKSILKKKQLLSDAVEIAAEKLEASIAGEVVNRIYDDIKESFNEKDKMKKKKKSTKRKRK